MKPLMVAALLSAFSTVALAKTTPIERLPDINKNLVSVEAMQEKAPVRLALCVNENILSRRNRQ